MATCPECNKNEYDDTKYPRCMECTNKMKAKALANQLKPIKSQTELFKTLEKNLNAKADQLNNNLYAIRRLLEIHVREAYKKELIWEKKTEKSKGDFFEKELGE